MDRIFHALADSTRRAMLDALTRGEASVSALSSPHDMSLAAAAKHIKVLEAADLIRVEKRGRSRFCRLEPRAFDDATDLLEHYRRFWHARLDGLAAHLEADTRNEGRPPKRSSGKSSAKPARKRKTKRKS